MRKGCVLSLRSDWLIDDENGGDDSADPKTNQRRKLLSYFFVVPRTALSSMAELGLFFSFTLQYLPTQWRRSAMDLAIR